VFLDEPTSGLDARAALLVMNALKKICNTGRTVVATIHQPSSAVFDIFDDLLLLKKGGETVFFGDLGDCSSNLVSYFESLGATCMKKGENPATWMLNVLSEIIMVEGEDGEEAPLDFGKAWNKSSNSSNLQRRLLECTESPDEELRIKYDFEFAATWHRRDNLVRLDLIFITVARCG
jgi:ABC-type multidrug transport system ATPase subunit